MENKNRNEKENKSRQSLSSSTLTWDIIEILRSMTQYLIIESSNIGLKMAIEFGINKRVLNKKQKYYEIWQNLGA